MPPGKRRREAEEAEPTTTIVPAANVSASVPQQQKANDFDLILTSEKRRGAFECDYCHADISRCPRIRCAVCPDFDLCLDCFATTDHEGVLSKWNTISEHPTTHTAAHGYRVCDSTRYPLFPTARAVAAATPVASNSTANASQDDNASTSLIIIHEDTKNMWTVEEDLRLLEGIKAHGLGNWGEIAEVVTGKTPKRCMERYFDDFLGRYGHILPTHTITTEEDDEDDGADDQESGAESAVVSATTAGSSAGNGPSNNNNNYTTSTNNNNTVEEATRTSKRRSAMLRSPSTVSSLSVGGVRKKFKAVPSDSLEGYRDLWTDPYLPPVDGVSIGQDVGRDQAYKAEQLYLKTITALESKEEVQKVRKEWQETRLGRPGGPTALPMRPDDVITMPGTELAGFMPRRGDFDVEWENEAEQAVADMEFFPGEPAQDKELKLKVIAIYNSKLDEREKRKNFILNRELYNYKKIQAEMDKLPKDERDLILRMRLFERFHTPEEHKQFLADILKAKRLRKEIAKLQMYRRMGIRTLAEAEKFELEKSRRLFHKAALKEKETAGPKEPPPSGQSEESESISLWKQYRSDRRGRESRGADTEEKVQKALESTTDGTTETLQAEDAMDVESPDDVKNDTEVLVDADSSKKMVEIQSLPGFALLSTREVELCQRLDLTPEQYLQVKKALITESLKAGLLPREDCKERNIGVIDVERTGHVIDFFVRVGWLTHKVGMEMKRTVSPEP